MARKTPTRRPKLSTKKLVKLGRKNIVRLIPQGKLDDGAHGDPLEEGVCLMEAVAYIAGEPHSDHPKCADRGLTAMGIDFNDGDPDEERQKLVAAIPWLVGSRTGSKLVRWKRAREFCRLLVRRLLEATLTTNVNAALTEVSDLATKRDVRIALALASLLEDELGVSGVDGVSAVVGALGKLLSSWDSSGISEDGYRRIIDQDLSSGLYEDDGAAQAELLAALGRIRR